MSLFDKKIKKPWGLKITGTEDSKERYDNVVKGLQSIDPDMSFKIESLLEDQLEQIIVKGEKELIKMRKALENNKEKNDSSVKEQMNT